jgi:hypothetical protein
VTANEYPVDSFGGSQVVRCKTEGNSLARPAQMYLKTIKNKSTDEIHKFLHFYSEILTFNIV